LNERQTARKGEERTMSDRYTWDWTRKVGKNKSRVNVYCGEEKLFTAKMEDYEAIRPLVDDANRGAAAQQAPAAVDLDALRERVLNIITEETDITFENTVTIKYTRARALINAAFDAAMKEQADAAKTADHP
jgi:hypothetical protein